MAGNEFKRPRFKHSVSLLNNSTPEGRYWKKFTSPISHAQVAAPTHINFSPTPPYNFAVSSSAKVTIYSSRTNAPIKSLTRFGDVAYCGVFRHDGKLLAAGDASGIVRVFDVDSKSSLRFFKGHSAAAQAVAWSPRGLQVLSGGDDNKVLLWDLATQELLLKCEGHGDYVRSAHALSSGDLWITGGYDRIVHVWDSRAGAHAVMTLHHAEAPVDACLPLPGASVVFSGGGTCVKAWDLVAGAGRELARFSNHAASISTLCLDGSGQRLLSAGYDAHVKVYNLQSYEVVHGLKFKAPVLSLALSPDNKRLVAGTTDNTVTIRQRQEPVEDSSVISKMTAPRGGTTRYFNRGKNVVAGEDDIVIGVKRGQKLKPYEKCLKKFKYQDALDLALTTRNPLIVSAMLEELRQRQGLEIALSGRDEASLEPILSFLNRHITNPKVSTLLIEVCQTLLDIYSQVLGQSEEIDELFLKLQSQIKTELNFQQSMMKLMGTLDCIISSTSNSGQNLTNTSDIQGV